MAPASFQVETSLCFHRFISAATSASSTAPSFPQQRRSLATFTSDGSGNTGNLVSILQRELDEEKEAASEIDLPAELFELKAEVAEEWTILEGISGFDDGSGGATGSGASVRMYKKTPAANGAKVGIVFHCQDSEDIGGDHFEEDDAENVGEDEEEEEDPSAVRFGVTVSKGGKTAVFHCVSNEAQATVESAAVRDGDYEDVLAQLAGGQSMDAALYQGPEYGELAEDLQESFTSFVRSDCGVDPNVAAFISMYADYREQEEYVSWLKSMQGIVSK